MENEEKKNIIEESKVLEEKNKNTEVLDSKGKEGIKEKEVEGNTTEKKEDDKKLDNKDEKQKNEDNKKSEKSKTKEEEKALKKAEKKAKREANKAKREEKRKSRSTAMKFFIGLVKTVLVLGVMCGIFVLGYVTRGLHPLEIYPLSLFNTEPKSSLSINAQENVARTDYGIIKNAGENVVIPTLADHLKVEELPYKFEVKAPDAAGNVYMNTTYTNNSKYVIKSYKLTLLLKDSNEKVYAISDDTVPVEATSPNIESFGPKSQKPEDVEILKYEIVAIGQDSKEVKITYDVKLGQYTVK